MTQEQFDYEAAGQAAVLAYGDYVALCNKRRNGDGNVSKEEIAKALAEYRELEDYRLRLLNGI